MTLISKQKIEDLYHINSEYCVSIFVPTHRAGEKVLQQEDALALKNELKKVKQKLSNKGMQEKAINKLLRPAQELVDNSPFWREQSDGLAIFITEDFFEKHTLPVYFEAFNYVSTSFYLKPLMPLFVDDGDFYLMTLDLGNVNLYDCTAYSYTEILIQDLIPEQKQDRVGYDYEEKNLQFRTQQAGSGQAVFHGHEAATGKRKNEIKKYFRAINDGLLNIFKGEKKPLLIASQDYLYGIYNTVNSYPYLVDTNIKVNLDAANLYEIHEVAWDKMAPIFDQKRKTKIERFNTEQGTGTTAVGINKVLKAAIHGKIDTLFCENKADVFGKYKNENERIAVTESEKSEEDENTISLMNLAAIKTLLKGGDVFLLEKENMPDSNAKVNALCRY